MLSCNCTAYLWDNYLGQLKHAIEKIKEEERADKIVNTAAAIKAKALADAYNIVNRVITKKQ